MKSPVPFRGMMPIMPTAIDNSCALDEASQRALVRYCLDNGAVAIGHFGYASEFHKISDPQRRRLTEIIVDEVAGRAPVFLGVAAPAVQVAVNYAKEAEALGANLIMATLPYIDVPKGGDAVDYYQALSDTTALPIIVQDAPHSSSILSVDVLLRMFDTIEHIHYVKAEGTNFLAKTHALMEQSKRRFPVIGGAGGKHLIHMLRIGVTSFMTGTEALDLHGAVVRSFLGGDQDEAARIYFERVLPYLMFYLDYSSELLKSMLHRRGVVACPKVIPPSGAAPMSDIERREFEWVLERIGYPKGIDL